MDFSGGKFPPERERQIMRDSSVRESSILDAASFPILIDHLIRDLYGTAEEMGDKVSLGWSTISRWRRGKYRSVREDTVQRLCSAAGLPLRAVWCILDRDRDRRRQGQRVPIADLSDTRTGPRTKKEIEEFNRRRRKFGNGLRKFGAAMILGAAISAVPATSAALPHSPDQANITGHDSPYRKRRSPAQKAA